MFDVVLVWKFDRFARSLKHLMDSLEEFGALGIDFVSFTEGIDTTTPSGQLLFHIVGAVAQFERDLIAERVRAGLAHARAIGKHIGRPRIVVDRDQVTVLRSQGRSLRETARRLEIPVSRVEVHPDWNQGEIPNPDGSRTGTRSLPDQDKCRSSTGAVSLCFGKWAHGPLCGRGDVQALPSRDAENLLGLLE